MRCDEEGCVNQCHKSERCSGINRYHLHKSWKCSLHASTTTTITPSNAPTVPVRQAKRSCKACRKPIRVDTQPVVCDDCCEHFHKKCSGLPRSAALDASNGVCPWTCSSCEERSKIHDSTRIVGGTLVETMATDRMRRPKNSLRILQWNADGISTKAAELSVRLKEDKYDIVLIQESKLRAHQRTPRMEGYSSIRQDRPANNGGGGLLSYIKDSLIFEHMQESSQNGTEASTFRVRMGKRKWAVICNVYSPPVRSHSSTQSTTFEIGTLPITPNAIILGDLNAHNLLWDPFQREDDRGEKLLDWTMIHDLTIMNDGTHTRVNKARAQASVDPVPDEPHGENSGGLSVPDISICGKDWHRNFTWCTVEGIGSSDHWPIAVEIHSTVMHGSVFHGCSIWRSAGVNWKLFQDQVELSISTIPPTPNDIDTMVASFNRALIDVGHRCVGTIGPGKRSKSWITPPIREALRKRNRLRGQISTHRNEWMEACRDVQELISQAKTDAWREVLDDAANIKDDSKMWRIVRGLNGSPETNSPNEVMSLGGRLILSNKRKADAFGEHYSTVSSLRMTKSDRTYNRELKGRLRKVRSEGAGANKVPSFTMNELCTAIGNIKFRGAPGPDNIPPSFLKNLGPRAMEMLLNIFNTALSSSVVPQSWKNATIIPILKSGKPASDLRSFRPISLTSCVVKLMERMISERLYHLAEQGCWFSKLQAGFRKGRGVEDQILRVTQRISDGFHKRERSILTLLDFSKAYDTVWRERLLGSLLDQGVPAGYVLLLREFLLNRQARVRFNGELGRSRKMNQGLPQGSVLAPILFLFYINNLAFLLPKELTISIYADDVSILASSKDRQVAQRETQKAVDVVAKWSREWKLTLNGEKSEVSLFTLAKTDRSWTPNISIGGKPVRFEPHPRLLGVTLDRTLTFNKQVELVVAKVARKMGMLRAVANSTWGWRKQDLRKIYLAHFQSVLHFASSSWQPWLSKTLINRLEATQNRCLRVITTQASSSPVEALRAETCIQSVKTTIDRSCLRSFEKALRMGEDHPRHTAATVLTSRRLKSRRDFRRRAEELYSEFPQLEVKVRAPILLSNIPPWDRGLNHSIVSPLLHGVRGRGDSEEEIRLAALRRMRELDADYYIYTDGSAAAGTTKGGAAAVITTGDQSSPNVVATIRTPGASYTCSYEEELRAMESAIDWLIQNGRPGQKAAVLTDSQSLCTALTASSPRLDLLNKKIRTVSPSLSIQWIPGHCGIPGNELADKAAKVAAAGQNHLDCPVSYGSSCANIRCVIKDPQIAHERTREVYGSFSKERDNKILSRKDQSWLAKVRTGHWIGFSAYRHRVDGVTDPICRRCGEEPEDLHHWLLRCPATMALRHDILGAECNDLAVLTSNPEGLVALSRKLGAP